MGRKGVDMGRNGRGERGVRAGGGGVHACRHADHSSTVRFAKGSREGQ